MPAFLSAPLDLPRLAEDLFSDGSPPGVVAAVLGMGVFDREDLWRDHRIAVMSWMATQTQRQNIQRHEDRLANRERPRPSPRDAGIREALARGQSVDMDPFDRVLFCLLSSPAAKDVAASLDRSLVNTGTAWGLAARIESGAIAPAWAQNPDIVASALRSGDADTLAVLLAHQSTRVLPEDGLFVARSPAMVSALLDWGLDPMLRNTKGEVCLSGWFQGGDPSDKVRALLARRPDLDEAVARDRRRLAFLAADADSRGAWAWVQTQTQTPHPAA